VQQKQMLQVQSLRRAKAFLDDHPDVARSLNSTNAKRQLDAAVRRLGPTVTEQGTRSRQTRGETSRRQQLERELRVGHMSPIAEFARAQLTGSAQFSALTPAANKMFGERLADAALSMADAAEPYAAQFTEAQFPADFLAQLRALAQEVKGSIDAKAKQQGQRAGATRAIDNAVREGRAAVRALNPVIRRALGTDDALHAEWRSARRVVKKAVRTAGNTTPAVAAPAVVTTPQAAATPVLSIAPSSTLNPEAKAA
jgi:hypothetical protein